ncbi:MAG: hypothetical protein J6Q30_02170 [Oscillospiraceae bacterium]|nr:hypothetical protein [Oscillospiraceae bacterium]
MYNNKNIKGQIRTLKLENIKTETYRYMGHFCIDVVETSEAFEAYIYDDQYGIKRFMFGVQNIDGYTKEQFVQSVANNAEEHMRFYIEEYCD